MTEYINNPDETQKIIIRYDDNKLWVHSGDLGYVTEDGFVFIIGRLKRYFMYIANGLHKKIFSLDIEKVLLDYPKIDNCAVVPVKDDITFQKPVAYIVLKENYNCSEIENELIIYCENNLLDGYVPTRFIFIDKLPLTKVGKIDYLTLEKLAEEKENGKENH